MTLTPFRKSLRIVVLLAALGAAGGPISPLVPAAFAQAATSPSDASAAEVAAPPAEGSEGGFDAPIPAASPAVAAARDAVYPSLVNLTAVRQTFSAGRTVRIPASGSGVIVSPDGLVLTNYHVAQDALRLSATLTTGEVVDAEVVGHDPLTDLSVLRLLPEDDRRFPAATLADSDVLEVGDPVLAMGNPLALSSSVSLGIVANPRRVFTDFTGTRIEDMDLGSGERTGVFTRWIQHDALILPGNSGGPLVDLQGRVVGINELGGGGLGFAIPSNVARRVLEQVVEHGRVPRGWLGFQVLPVARLGWEDGALVSSVLPGSPAAAAGLEPGDRLLAIGGEPVQVRFFEQVPLLYARLAALPIGGSVALEVERPAAAGARRDGADGADDGGLEEGGLDEDAEVVRRTLTATVGEMEPSTGRQAEVPGLGATVQEITGPMALDRSLPSSRGLVVTGVRPGSPLEAARPPVTPGDVLLRFGGRSLATLEDLSGTVEESLAAPAGAAVLFRRSQEELVTVVERARERRSRQGGELPSAWLGVQTQVLTPEIAAALGLSGEGGFRVTQVYPWTEASEAGLRVGDVIVGLDGESLEATRPQQREDLRRAVERRSPGEEAVLEVLRPAEAGDAAPERLELAVALEPRPVDPGAEDRVRQETLEVAVRDVSFQDRLERGWEEGQGGALVVEVEPGSWAQMAGLQLGDLVLRVDGRPVGDARGFATAVAAALEEQPELLPLFVRRGPRTHFVFIEPDWIDPAAEPAAAGGDR